MILFCIVDCSHKSEGIVCEVFPLQGSMNLLPAHPHPHKFLTSSERFELHANSLRFNMGLSYCKSFA